MINGNHYRHEAYSGRVSLQIANWQLEAPTAPNLLTPGPLALSMCVKGAMLTDIGSRSASMRSITQRSRSMLKRLVRAERIHEVIPIQGSGSWTPAKTYRL